MKIEEVLDALDDVLDKAWSLPMTGGKLIVDAEKVRDLIDDIRINLPMEIRQAKAVVADRNEILNVAKRESEQIIRKAEERAKVMVSKEEVLKTAQNKAADLVTQTQSKTREMWHAAAQYTDDALRKSEDTLEKSEVMLKSALADVKNARQALRESGKQQNK